jgi:predicted ATPase
VPVELLERGSALGALDDALSAATRGRGSIAMVSGEPGIGKTALVTWFARQHATDARVLLGMCDDLATPRPLGAFRDLAGAFSGPLAESLRHGQAAHGFATLLLEELATSRAPTVLVVEDVQWADQATVDALTVVGRRLDDLPVLLVLTFRTGEVHPVHPVRAAIDAMQRTRTLHVQLAPLSRQAVARLAGEDADRIYALSGGNPFFVTELVAQRGDPPPPSLANAVLGRVARLDEDCRRLLELISVVPGGSPSRCWTSWSRPGRWRRKRPNVSSC